jgi:hypothetical protein
VNSKQVDRLVHGLCAVFFVASGAMLYANSVTTELDATITAKNIVVGRDVLSQRGVQTDKGAFALGSMVDEKILQEGRRYHLTLYKGFTDPFMIGVPGTIRDIKPAP